ncbi:hypothetical protein CVT25_007673 [Psilocybe cyanescens]|uniref:Uncharacterized protein n=1 Tax=Psilocybe cyanescens TaxID=93625 RepID=A0A409XSX2_PSICY|nr:hypothetical protein CVT25_007673 [Psilocybe cyanescens]
MRVLSIASFFPTTTISLFPFSRRRLALFTTAAVTIAAVPHPPPPFSPRDGLVITVCEVDRVAAASPLFKMGGKGAWEEPGKEVQTPVSTARGTDEGTHSVLVAVDGSPAVGSCGPHIVPPRCTPLAATLPAPSAVASSCGPPIVPPRRTPLWPPHYRPPRRCQLVWPPHRATLPHPSVATTLPVASAVASSRGPPIVPPRRIPRWPPRYPLHPLLPARVAPHRATSLHLSVAATLPAPSTLPARVAPHRATPPP